MSWFHSRRDQDEEEFEAFVACSARSLLRTGWQKVRRMSAPTAYARRILINLARDDRRRAPHRPLLLDASPEGPIDDAATTLARSDELMRGLARLSPRLRLTVVLRFYEDMTEAGVAETLGCSVGTVKTQTSRALNHLRGFLGEQADGVKQDAEAETKEMIR